jgi:single-stranded-DNA-specific exonuclease
VLTAEDLVPVQRVDAIAAGGDVGHALAEELTRLEPFGHGNPAVRLMLPAARLTNPKPMGEARSHVRFTVEAGGIRARAVAFACEGRLPVGPDTPADLVAALELDHYGGSVEPRLVLKHAQASEPEAITVLDELDPSPQAFLAAALAELHADLSAPAARASTAGAPGSPVTLRAAPVDRRDRGVAGTLAALVASGEPVLAVVADVPARVRGISSRLGGFALVSWPALIADPALAAPYAHVVALDPPPWQSGVAHATVLAWGAPELDFAGKIHEREYRLRDPLTSLYRTLRDAGGAQGERLSTLLRGEGPARSAALAGRLLRVLCELELVVVDEHGGAVTVPPAQRTELERSPAYRAYGRILEEGLAWLTQRTSAAPRAA